jgi:DNA invertase Pin-like site-specific DNA recombinase
MKAVAYIRVSTDKVEQELSLQNQRDFFEKYVNSKGDELVHIYSDQGKSATKMTNRKELQRMLRDAKRGRFQKIYVKDISRIFRNMLDFIQFSRDIIEERKLILHLVNMGEGRDVDAFMLSFMAMFAEYESKKISERVRFGKNISKEKGIVPNFVFGYERVDKWTLQPNDEAEWVKKIFDLYTEENLGMGSIAAYLYEHRVKTKKLKDGEANYNWSQIAIARMLNNRVYTGVIINNKQNIKNLYSGERIDVDESEWMITERPEFRIISDEQFAKAQALIVKNKRTFPTDPITGKRVMTRRSEAHILSNLLKCGECGGSYRRFKRQYSKDGPIYYRWSCDKRHVKGQEKCDAKYIKLEEADVLSALSQLFAYLEQDRDEFFKLVESACNRLIKEYIRQSANIDLEGLHDDLSDLQEQRERIKTMIRKGLLEIDEGEADMRELNDSIRRVSAIINEQDVTDVLTQRVKTNLQEFFRNFDEFSYQDGFTNAGLKTIVKEIKVISNEELQVYFNVDDTVEGLFFPMEIKGSVIEKVIENTDTEMSDDT